ncbi:Cytochrome c/c1 heme-lyase [Phytophthora cactorum]|nr:Cytochrome c/c1 heme-lyase [Phytophthora cactorum]
MMRAANTLLASRCAGLELLHQPIKRPRRVFHPQERLYARASDRSRGQMGVPSEDISKEPVKLKKFMGKPTEYSPKAKMMNLLGWSVLPFDRHDWVVDRDGKEVRYVIDFYSGAATPGKPLSVYLDVRPALDSWKELRTA